MSVMKRNWEGRGVTKACFRGLRAQIRPGMLHQAFTMTVLRRLRAQGRMHFLHA